jgi:hypothetical protein
MTPLAESIENFLLTERRWVSAEELSARFGVRDRQLRDDRQSGRLGLCTEFTISGNEGYKHFRNATDAEFERFAARNDSHSFRQLNRTLRLRRARESARTGQPPFEKFTGQGLLI